MRRPVVVSVLAVVAACVLVILTAWAALIGPRQVFTGDGPQWRPSASASAEETPVPSDEASPRPAQDVDPPAWTRTVLAAVLAAVQAAALVGILLVGTLLGRRLYRAYRQRSIQEQDARGDPVAPDDLDVFEARRRIAAAMEDDAHTQATLLEEGEPRNAIVACWHRFEVQAERAGLGRRPAETSSELALRMLADEEIDAEAVSRLLALYREARFSGHPIDEEDRRAAIEALKRIRAGSGVVG